MDLQTLRQDVLDRVGPGTGLSSSMLNRWINEGQRAFCAAYPFVWLEKTDTATTVSGTKSYTIPTDCRKLLAVYVDDDQWTYAPFSQKENIPSSSGSNSKAYYTFDDKIYLIPTPTSAVTIDYFYIKNPTTMSADTDTPTIPERFQEALVYYALAKSYGRDENRTQENDSMAQFNMIFDLAKREGTDRQKAARRRMVSIEEYHSYTWPNQTYNRRWSNN